ncbi:CRISPR-associated endonuclease Cas1 [Thermoproteota archaeon]
MAILKAAIHQVAHQNAEKRFYIANKIVEAKLERTINVVEWLDVRYDINPKSKTRLEKEINRLEKSKDIRDLLFVEGRVAESYWNIFQSAIPKNTSLHLESARNIIGSRSGKRSAAHYVLIELEQDTLSKLEGFQAWAKPYKKSVRTEKGTGTKEWYEVCGVLGTETGAGHPHPKVPPIAK